MDDRDKPLPPEIEAEAGELISELGSAGWTVIASDFDKNFFGNWYVDWCRDDQTLRIVKDRSQYMIAGPPPQRVKDAGLWRAFDTFEEFHHVVKIWMLTDR